MTSWFHLLGMLSLAGDAPQASLTGTVRDLETGSPVPGAVVSLPHQQQRVLTDSLGRYRLTGIAAGPREVSAQRIGYGTWTVSVLVPDSGSLTVDFALRPQPVPLLALEARGTAPGRGPAGPAGAASPFPQRRVTAEDLALHPMLPEPDYLAALAGGAVLVAPENPDGIQIGGGSADQVGMLLDGIPLLNAYHAGGTWQGWNPDIAAGAELTTAPLEGPPTLGGALAIRSISPGDRPELRGTLSATQTRMALRAPFGGAGAGVVLSIRRGFPGLLDHSSEASHFGGGSGDAFAKVQLPAFGGMLSVLGHDGEDDLTAAAQPSAAASPRPSERHRLGWDSRSVGLRWAGPHRDRLLTVTAWHAATSAAVRWGVDSLADHLSSSRNDAGVSLGLRGLGEETATGIVLDLALGSSRYRATRSAGSPGLGRDDRQPRALVRLDHRRQLGPALQLRLGMAGTVAAGRGLVDPSAELAWRIRPPLTLSVGYVRHHQLEQSLRNPELVTGTLLPVNLSVTGGGVELPIARSDLVSAAAEWEPAPAWRLGLRGYVREARGLALVAMSESGPFATGPVVSGTSSTVGVALEAETRRPWGVAQASYGYQYTRNAAGGTRYQPAAAVPHALSAGLTLLPARPVALRVSFIGLFGRRATPITGPFEWESCNLQDHGCEFAGTPALTGALGDVSLPAYLRLDLGFRYEVRPAMLGRHAAVALFGTVSNLLSRRNFLTEAVDAGGTATPVEMRPRAPLVVGLDWRF
ncbi:MAG: carboxypeptidase-like regulatory domain-containing protein [Gemmatimonadota bacterium]|nr:carboxypeptidase-like regulatory domain-containing protein [Gemmatimonadota bacterium]